ncbi:hypothetical protein Tco_1109048 [Tanacetum coccineum]
MKRGFRGVPRPLLRAMFSIVDPTTTIPHLSQPAPPTPIAETTTASPSPSPAHEPMEHTFEQQSTAQQPPTPRQEATTSQLMTMIGDLEKQLKETKQTFGKAILTLVERVKTLEVALKRKTKRVLLSDSEDEEIEAQGRKTHDLDPLVFYALEKALEEEEVAKQVHLDSLLAQRLAEEQELTEQQKKRKAQVQFEAQSYTEEDWDTIRSKLEANAELKESVLGKDLTVEDYAKRMVELNQGTWKLTQLKKLNFEEVKAEFEKLRFRTKTATKAPYSIRRIIKQGRKGVYQIVKENGTDMVYISFGAMLTDISRDDLTKLYRIVMKKHEYIVELGVCIFYKQIREIISLSAKVCKAMLDKKLEGGKPDEDCYKLLKMMEKQTGAKGLTSPEQTATGKGISNPFMAVMVCQKPYGIQLTNVSSTES